MWKFDWKMGKDKWSLLIAAGILLLVIAIPTGPLNTIKQGKNEEQNTEKLYAGQTFTDRDYEEELEERVEEILGKVQGVGKTQVMIVLKSSAEKIMRVDRTTSSSTTEEQDSGGGSRKTDSSELTENTILTNGSGDRGGPVIEKEMKPEISGIIITAEGGGSPTVKAEISEAMVALFDIPAHKIKVLKMVE